MIEQQIELEKKMTQQSVDTYRLEILKAQQKGTFGITSVATKLISRILDNYKDAIQHYLDEYLQGKAVRSTTAADVISRIDVEVVAYITARIILSSTNSVKVAQKTYQAIGQGLEDEFKMREFKSENSHYYKSIQEDLNKRGAKANRKKNITTGVFNKRLEFHLEKWTSTERYQTGLVLTRLFIESTGLCEYKDEYKKGKTLKFIVPTKELSEWIEQIGEKMEVMQPFFLPMVCKPKDWVSIMDGGYISPYLKRNKFIKNNDRSYLQKVGTADMPHVYEAVNHLQSTAWQINSRVLNVVKELWQEGKAIAELPDREDEILPIYPYPEKTKEDVYTPEEAEEVKKWKRDTYEIHKRNVKKRSVRILVSQILRIAGDFKGYEKIYFPHQMDFRGRVYPIPVLLQPQGSDLSKGLLHFSEGKKVDGESIKWLQVHGANVYGYDKCNYTDRIKWVLERHEQIKAYASNPLEDRGWAEADKPFQFLAFCMEYTDYLNNPDDFTTHIPVQLDGTCNGLQHYSALLRDKAGGTAVNLTDAEIPADIYAKVAEKLKEKLNEILGNGANNLGVVPTTNDSNLSQKWLDLGINRKLTKRPVMVLPYGGTMISCREYIGEYLKDTYSMNMLWEHFNIGDNPTDCVYKVSVWLSKYLWEAISETLQAAIIGMDYLKKIARIVIGEGFYIEWLTPIGLLVRQDYKARKSRRVETELYGSIIKATMSVNLDEADKHRQVNGICPNFIHSLDAAALMFYLIKCKDEGIDSFMTVHDCYGTLAPDTTTSARLLREAFVEIYRTSILDNFTEDVLMVLQEELRVTEDKKKKDRLTKILNELPQKPEIGELDIEDVLSSKYFFN